MQKSLCCQRQVALRRACAELARFWRKKTCMILPGLFAAKIELHMAMPHMSGTAGSMMRDRLVRRGLLPGKLQPDSCKQSWRQEAHASYAILDFKSIRIHVRIHVRMHVCIALREACAKKKIPCAKLAPCSVLIVFCNTWSIRMAIPRQTGTHQRSYTGHVMDIQ